MHEVDGMRTCPEGFYTIASPHSTRLRKTGDDGTVVLV